MGNKAAYIHLRGSDLRPQFHQFTAVVSLSPTLGPQLSPAWARGESHSQGRAGFCLWNSEDLLPPHPCCPPISVSDCVPLVLQPHPDVKPMAYASTLLQLGMM